MKISIDNIFIQELNKKYNLNLTFSSFKQFYTEVVKSARDRDPKTINRRKDNSLMKQSLIHSLSNDD